MHYHYDAALHTDYQEAMNIRTNSRHLRSYKQLFQNLYSPFKGIEVLFEAFFTLMVIMAVSATVSVPLLLCAQWASQLLCRYQSIGIVFFTDYFLVPVLSAELRRLIWALPFYGHGHYHLLRRYYLYGRHSRRNHVLHAGNGTGFRRKQLFVPNSILHALYHSGFQCVVIPTADY